MLIRFLLVQEAEADMLIIVHFLMDFDKFVLK